ncbi:nicotinate-nucleotide--dimethylbenzimidazole phosphoribosyltransferase [Ketobacter sp. MCCC 1A13808]|uniref:nicotinate-nucleotide--dimethylbenzimidazole phosphoribosyltransferase n=1 Tax=Ketobacter sp. MCCC 1A13808 TaxID=2602738 RepID=UPI0012EC303F|nr:nicotinate-nucleotide--dimethylbenzimidazole phosphoribosyltransferase [Ketobacter sp. MCCC 1A13808]MVF11164.1 nicotinate-nucleotide--dimethylbenzimidazole phosphoribosyltransferase [Ketobacter sp. MCCC 1A13808]
MNSDNSTPPWWRAPVQPPCATMKQTATERQLQLTKPPGALGKMEQIAVQLAAIQNNPQPSVEAVYITVFAGDHGIVEEGVSAFPQTVTVEMQRNFIAGGAAISVIARHLDAQLEVVNTGTHAITEQLPGVLHEPVALQTNSFLRQEAMTEAQWQQAMSIGKSAVARACAAQADLFIGGEMGIGNTTSATAILCSLCDKPVTDIAGPGTGLDQQGVARKIDIIRQAIEFHQANLTNAESIARILGGFEITSLTGAYIAAAQNKLPVVVDGFICTAAAAIALQLNPGIAPYLFFSHSSAEPGHRAILEHLGIDFIMDLNLRLGEGSGAATVVPLLRLACALHNEMATFAEAAVSAKLGG